MKLLPPGSLSAVVSTLCLPPGVDSEGSVPVCQVPIPRTSSVCSGLAEAVVFRLLPPMGRLLQACTVCDIAGWH